MNLIKIYLLILSLISLSYSSPNVEQHGVNSGSEIIFDLKNIDSSNFTIYESCNETLEPKTVYQFVPKKGKTVVKIKHEDRSLWRKIDDNSVEDIVIWEQLKLNTYYSISLVNEKNEKNYLYSKLLHSIQHDSGLAEHLHDISGVAKQGITLNKFNINSIFDYKFYKKTINYVPKEKLSIIEFKTKSFENFDEISDDETEIYKEKKLESITIINKNSQRYLIKLKTESGTFLYFQYDTKWKRISQEEYNKLNPEQVSVGLGEYGSGKVTDTKLDIGSKDSSYSEFAVSYLSVPTMVYRFENLNELYDGNELIFNKPIKTPKIMVFKGKTTNEMIEIVHTVSVSVADFMNFDKNDPNGNNFNLGKLNTYYIRKENKWVQCTQLEFFNNLKILAISNLKEYNVEANRRLVELSKSGKTKSYGTTEYETLKEQIDKNEKAIEIILKLQLRDNSNRVETTVDSFYKSEKLGTHCYKGDGSTKNETEEPMPVKKPDTNSGKPEEPKKKQELPKDSGTVKEKKKEGKGEGASDLDKEEDEDGFYTSSFLLFLPILFLII
ncbi:hypothetical protein MACK_002390 [Theileria orientalis]|uniref:Uncharacterized protein n=1 Tax=Theileria orientalis TaxID=68886 RepID=A0A976QVA0_THEOR|nr:hypothetical protein MACK_002390 [Theileria orientalis]